MEEIELIMDMAKEGMEKALNYTQGELSKIRAGRASVNILDGVMVEYYGAMSPLNQIAVLSIPDARTVQIKPFEKKSIGDIERAIIAANLGLTPANDGEFIRLNIPPLTEERRRDLVKRMRVEIENAKISIRKSRQEANDELRKQKADGVSEDIIKDYEDEVQKLTDSYIKKADEMSAAKEEDIMQV